MAGFATAPSGPVMIALSGGADSAAAAWASVASNRVTRAVHVHHGLQHSDVMSESARAVAVGLGIDFEVLAVTVPAGPSFEAQARDARLHALEAVRAGGEWIVTGHTLDDQVETVLMRLIRGTGLDGLVGIRRVRHPYMRPLLAVSRSDTREIASLAGLPWRDDPENLDERHLRNRVRRSLLPTLETTFGSAPFSSLARMSRVVGEDIEVLESLAATIPRDDRPGEVRLAVGGLMAAAGGVAARAIRSAMVELDPPYPPEMGTVDEVLKLLTGRMPPVSVGRVTVSRSGPWLVFSAAQPAAPPAPVELAVPGSAVWGRHRFDIVIDARRPVMSLSPMSMTLPLAGIDGLTVRAAVATDVIAIGTGHKRVFDALAESAIPAENRHLHPVVLVGDTVVWIPGVRRAVWSGTGGERYLCAVATEEAHWQRYER